VLGAVAPVGALLVRLLLDRRRLWRLLRLRRGVIAACGERDGGNGEGTGGKYYGESCASHAGQPARGGVSSR